MWNINFNGIWSKEMYFIGIHSFYTKDIFLNYSLLNNLSSFMFMRAKNHFLSAPLQLNTNTSLFASFNSLTITLNKNLLNFTDC